jgi:hypothetical protein
VREVENPCVHGARRARDGFLNEQLAAVVDEYATHSSAAIGQRQSFTCLDLAHAQAVRSGWFDSKQLSGLALQPQSSSVLQPSVQCGPAHLVAPVDGVVQGAPVVHQGQQLLV